MFYIVHTAQCVRYWFTTKFFINKYFAENAIAVDFTIIERTASTAISYITKNIYLSDSDLATGTVGEWPRYGWPALSDNSDELHHNDKLQHQVY